MKLIKKSIIFSIVLVLISAGYIPNTLSDDRAIIYVDDSGGADYTTIQEAINNANPGDTIYVYNGSYNEALNVNKKVDLIGESNIDVLIDGSGNGHAVNINSDYVNFSNFSVQDYDTDNIGIVINNEFSRIFNNRILYTSSNGIIAQGNNNYIFGNIFDANANGIEVNHDINNITIENNFINNCRGCGIFIDELAKDCIIKNNIISNNGNIGIFLKDCDFIIIENNTIQNNR